jgi:hypothetical protein
MRMIVLPGVRLPGAKAAGASVSGGTAPTTGLSRPSLSRVARSASRARSGSTTMKTARPSLGWILGGMVMVTSVLPARPMWSTQVMVLDDDGGEVIAITTAGEKPNVRVGQPLIVSKLEALPWATNGRNGVAFRAEEIKAAGVPSGRASS